MIDPGFWESVTVASWPYFDRLLFIGLFSHADDQGRLMGHPVLVRSKVFPFDDVPMDDITTALAKFETSESIIRYTVDGKDYIQLVNWWKWQHAQWAWPSKMPPPPNWEDCICFCAGTKVTRVNWPVSPDTIWRRIRRTIFERDSYTCRYCGAPAQHVDHVHPRSQGGGDELDNLVAACAPCNLSKGARTPQEAGMTLGEY